MSSDKKTLLFEKGVILTEVTLRHGSMAVGVVYSLTTPSRSGAQSFKRRVEAEEAWRNEVDRQP